MMSRALLRHVQHQPRLRLFCFSYAGGNAAAYLPWQPMLGPEIEVCAFQLPGRGNRFGEPPPASLSSVVDAASAAVDSLDGIPFAFFGHSLGALVAFELCHERRQRGLTLPRHLLVSGCCAPHRRTAPRHLHLLDDARLIEELRRYEGTPADVLDNRELMALLLPTIRADFALVADYIHRDRQPLDLPISTLAGLGDVHESADQYTDWRTLSRGPHYMHWFDGGHFFIQPQLEAVLAVVKRTLALHLPGISA